MTETRKYLANGNQCLITTSVIRCHDSYLLHEPPLGIHENICWNSNCRLWFLAPFRFYWYFLLCYQFDSFSKTFFHIIPEGGKSIVEWVFTSINVLGAAAIRKDDDFMKNLSAVQVGSSFCSSSGEWWTRCSMSTHSLLFTLENINAKWLMLCA